MTDKPDGKRWIVGGAIVGAIAGFGVANSVTYAPDAPQMWFYAPMMVMLAALGAACGSLVDLLPRR